MAASHSACDDMSYYYYVRLYKVTTLSQQFSRLDRAVSSNECHFDFQNFRKFTNMFINLLENFLSLLSKTTLGTCHKAARCILHELHTAQRGWQ